MPQREDKQESAAWEMAKMVEHDKDAQAERAGLLGDPSTLAAPSEIELLGEILKKLEQMPREGRWAALRYLKDRFAADMPPQMY